MVGRPKKILLFGGAFNPPHKGHELLLRAAIAETAPDLALVVPSAISPHKPGGDVSFFDRAAMCRCFLDEGGRVAISQIENRGRKRRSYTLKTLRWLRKKYPGAALYLLVGGDMLAGFTAWKGYRRILALAAIVAARRADAGQPAVLAAKAGLERAGGRVLLLDIEPIEISSSELRAALKQRGDTARYLSDDVSNYIEQHKLYL